MKVGLELYLAAGTAIVEELIAQDFSVFLDLKFHDIPNTVAGAVRSAASMGASLLTIHAAGGPAMLAAAAEAAAASPNAPRLLAVTVLTSMDRTQLAAIGIESSAADQVLRLARLATASGIQGLVCSAEEVRLLRQEIDASTQLVVPGIRPAGAAVGDQKRIATPADAIRAGASKLVVGRPITRPLIQRKPRKPSSTKSPARYSSPRALSRQHLLPRHRHLCRNSVRVYTRLAASHKQRVASRQNHTVAIGQHLAPLPRIHSNLHRPCRSCRNMHARKSRQRVHRNGLRRFRPKMSDSSGTPPLLHRLQSSTCWSHPHPRSADRPRANFPSNHAACRI